MSFIINNWMLELILVLSGGMLVWPLVQGRFSKMKEVGTLNVTQLINRQNAVLLDVREAKEFEGGHLPNAVHIPLSATGRARQRAREAHVAAGHRLLRARPAQPGRGRRIGQARVRRHLSPDGRFSRLEGRRAAAWRNDGGVRRWRAC